MKASIGLSILTLLLISAGCSQDTTGPVTTSNPALNGVGATTAGANTSKSGGAVGYEPAYYDGSTVYINAIELAQNAPQKAQADLYEVVYPIGWQGPPPQCNPCDHEHNGIDFTDYHDHVLDSVPSSPGHGEFRPLWHVTVVLPNYDFAADHTHDDAVGAAYGKQLPITSEADVEALLNMNMPDGTKLATTVDPGIYFLCAVVDPHAVH